MDSTPADDWDESDRELLRDEAVQEAFTGRPASRALARAMFALARHPRVRFDPEPAAGRHPSELPEYRIDLRGLALRATRHDGAFVPLFEGADGIRVDAREALLLEGPPTWIASRRAAFLIDGTFDARKAIEAGRLNGETPRSDGPPSARAIVRVAPYLSSEERSALGIAEAAEPSAELVFSWSGGALVATVTFVDRASAVRAPYAAVGAIATHGARYVRFTSEFAAALRTRLIEAGFVPRGTDNFALHGAGRAAAFVRDVLPGWSDLDRRLDSALLDVASGNASVDINVSAARSGEGGDWFELRVDVFVGDAVEPLTQIELSALLASSERFADVRGKLVDIGRLRERNALISDLSERKRSGFAALLALRDELHDNFSNVALPPEVEALREKLRGFQGIAEIEPPEITGGTLRGYQKRALDFLAYLSELGFGGVLADDMGLGKTLMVIAYLLWRRHTEGAAPSLVIAPTSVTHTWENEIARFAPELTTLRLHSGSERAARYDEVGNADVVITSYALARLDAEQLAKHHFRSLILDEAQNAKNPSSQIAQGRARAARRPSSGPDRYADREFAARPLGDLRLRGAGIARNRGVVPAPLRTADRRRGRRRDRDPAFALEPFVLRRTKEDVAPELPERTEVVLECDLSPLQKRLYRGVAEAARREVLAMVDAGGIENATVHVLAALTRLRQICAHPGLLFTEHREDPEASAKFEAFLETVEEILSGGHRLLVFSAFASMLRIMRTALDKRGIGYGYLDGSTKDKDRQTEVANFMKTDGPPLFLCSLKAGGVGLTLTAADYVVLYDPWWNPAIERQAIDRTHRIGQHRAVTAYRLVTTGTVEEKIRQLADRKTSLSKSIIKADGALAKSLTRADLEMLLADPP